MIIHGVTRVDEKSRAKRSDVSNGKAMLLRRASAHAFTIPRTLIDSSRRSFHHNPETSVLDVLKQMELDNSRLLHITKKKIEQRVLAFREVHVFIIA